jgi:hypothetical protein
MSLEMKPVCEKCRAATPPEGHAVYICSFECTFCEDCSEKMLFRCPNCQGELVRRPPRSPR